jgi:hypothetical protein
MDNDIGFYLECLEVRNTAIYITWLGRPNLETRLEVK